MYTVYDHVYIMISLPKIPYIHRIIIIIYIYIYIPYQNLIIPHPKKNI
jgi:hypothetical protein